MKLLARFNLIFGAVFAVGIGLAIWLASQFSENDTKAQVLAQARLMMLSMSAVRSYTEKQVNPPLDKLQRREGVFLPQTVPNYAATQVFDLLHQSNDVYTYKEATLNPTNLVDRAADWEADIIHAFRNDKSLEEKAGERLTPMGRSMYYARPIRVTAAACLECHSTREKAPAAILRQYGRANGFGWHLDEVVGAQIVSVPEEFARQIAQKQLRSWLVYLVAMALVALLVLDLVLVATVIRPVAKLSRLVDEMSQGKMSGEDIPVTGKDEISTLAAAFNRMQRSLGKALRLLENGDST